MLFWAILVGYLIGSIPSAYLAVRFTARRDIRFEGSGNVGALNSYEVTRKKWIGAAVLLADAAKGAGAVVVTSQLISPEYSYQGAAGLAAIFGHNFNVWLRFHGGRGLATALGVMLLLGWIFAVVWCLLWFIAYRILHDVHGGNVAATILAPLSLLVLPDSWIVMSSWTGTTPPQVALVGAILCIFILVRHGEYLRRIVAKRFSSDH